MRTTLDGYTYGIQISLTVVPVENGWEVLLPNTPLVPEDFDSTKNEFPDSFRVRGNREMWNGDPRYMATQELQKSPESPIKMREQKMSEAKDRSRMFFKYSELEEMIAFLRTKLV